MGAKEEVCRDVDARRHFGEGAALTECLVDGDPRQRAAERAVKRRALLVSVMTQVTVLGVLVLVPLLSKTQHISLAGVMPLPPYRRARAAVRETQVPAQPPRPVNGFQFCLSCAPVAPRPAVRTEAGAAFDTNGFTDDPRSEGTGENCPACIGITPATRPQLPAPPDSAPRVVHVTHIDPAMLLHRVEPIYPVLARQMRREGTVELRALIAEDGSVQSLEVLEGDAAFVQSALAAVKQWHYKPTILNGRAVEVDTYITVIYKLAQ